MTQRTTNAQLDASFASVVRMAKGLGIDTSGWSFGRNVGLCYNIYDKPAGRMISRDWTSKKEAWYGMQDMSNAFLLLAKGE